ncbi:MAG: hypothetical protein UU48_C0013G0003 [Candidatus Uhrbacteria bacterium GW2011_GWF2_41_16]|jgi:hypothetical protein|uniref:Integral membrane protein TerC n=2 Tax=Candidatus Uhriibacteriota TaxID=1752732 RepID=A0A0G0V8Z3_9BACT|nr:MAG: hypothetical protein UU35_C0012G0003 [Candidatus Uhrbacteria bacterium GW2011_GWC2_41_11]KKR97513.1 MAG: hypothetical protein UU48_C0013G0003 [Candidatus Uhrbacteria bacterium GW2011_GWF2_41_16]HBP00049.1 hypothetical protein [Candidatus Uhrbacteria bacterium]
MDFANIILIVLGLIVFEIISSIDNAVVNADVLTTMSEKGRKWFLFYGIIFAVFIVRGILPLLIVYFTNPGIGIFGAVTATFSGDESILASVERSKPILLAGGGVYLLFLFFYWLFVEKKEYAFFLERHIHERYSFWFYATASVMLLSIVWMTIPINPFIALGAVVGSTAFFITNGFKMNAEEKERELKGGHLTDISKILYLEMIDTTFSIDGVLGAFAFTLSVPLIFFGNGLGAFVVRYITIHGVRTVKKYRYLKNGAMYSIASLGLIMLLESLHVEVRSWIPPIITFIVVGIFFWLSKKELQIEGVIKE